MSKYYLPPYLTCDWEPGDKAILIAAGSDVIATVELHPKASCEANEYAHNTAEFIVRACNSHDSLVAILKQIVSWHEEQMPLAGAMDQARVIIATASETP